MAGQNETYALDDPPLIPKEAWEGDGMGGVGFNLPSGGWCFISRGYGQGNPKDAQPLDWHDAQVVVRALRRRDRLDRLLRWLSRS